MPDTPPKFTINDEPVKRGPGRPKGSTNASASATAVTQDVKKALATLDSMYNLVATGLMVFGLEKTATDWISSAEELKKTNEDALKASPQLAKAIAGAGSTGGAATFFITHAMAFASLAGAMRSELADKRADRILRDEPVPDGVDSDPTTF